MTSGLAEYFEEHPNVARDIMEKSLAASRARGSGRERPREQSRRGVLTSGSLPGKLTPCQDRRSELTEIFLVEGDSAAAPPRGARDPRYQAILPLRGKVLNVEKTRLDKVYANPSLTPIIQSLGCGIGEEFDPEKLRYGKIIIMADADVDGSHIRHPSSHLFLPSYAPSS